VVEVRAFPVSGDAIGEQSNSFTIVGGYFTMNM
jgi:hypothetical protein